MNLLTAQEMVFGSSPDDWEVWSEDHSDGETHGLHATFRNDVALELHWGRVENDSFEEDWTSNFRKPQATVPPLGRS